MDPSHNVTRLLFFLALEKNAPQTNAESEPDVVTPRPVEQIEPEAGVAPGCQEPGTSFGLDLLDRARSDDVGLRFGVRLGSILLKGQKKSRRVTL